VGGSVKTSGGSAITTAQAGSGGEVTAIDGNSRCAKLHAPNRGQ